LRQSALELLSGAPGLRPADEHEKHPSSSFRRRGRAGRKGSPALRIHYDAQRALQWRDSRVLRGLLVAAAFWRVSWPTSCGGS